MIGKIFLSILAMVWSFPASASTIDLNALPLEELGEKTIVLSETNNAASDAAWTPEFALAALQTQGKPGQAKVLNLGIERQTLWLTLDLNNPTQKPLTRKILLGQAWLDHIELWLWSSQLSTPRYWKTGDEVAGQPALDDVHGYVFEHYFAPGKHRLLVRIQTADQLTVNLRIRDPRAADAEGARDRYLYGFLYGFIVSLVAYNLMLYLGLRRKVYVLYSIYLLTFLLLNMAYTGRATVWLWGDWVVVQRFSIVSLIVLMPTAGLLFAREFLDLPRFAPRIDRWVRIGYSIGPILLLIAILTNSYTAAVWLAFVVLGLFILAMVALGVHGVRRKHPAARYFLVGALFSMLGTALTEFSVWGPIPFNVWAYRGIEIGMMIDATLLALALAQVVRAEVAQRQDAERTARTDPLTLLENRRGFGEASQPLLALAERTGKPLSALLVDIDHFKLVNDRHGHLVGDRVLIEVADCLRQSLRPGDCCARWGGEEFVLLFPDTDVGQAAQLAERLRLKLSDILIHAVQPPLQVTASMGVAQWRSGEGIANTVHRADTALYRAKANGRNRVETVEMMEAVA